MKKNVSLFKKIACLFILFSFNYLSKISAQNTPIVIHTDTDYFESFENGQMNGWRNNDGLINGYENDVDWQLDSLTEACDGIWSLHLFRQDTSITSSAFSTLISPVFDFSNATSARLSLCLYCPVHHLQETVVVYARSSEIDGWRNIHVFRPSYIGSGWVTASLEMSGLSPTCQFALMGRSYRYDLMLDAIRIEAADTLCQAPDRPYQLESTPQSATISWFTNGQRSLWEVEYGVAGFVLGNGTRLTVSQDTLEINSLQSNTEYDVYVRTHCVDTMWSDWSPAGNIQTACSVQTLTPNAVYEERFDAYSPGVMPNCWLSFFNGTNEQYVPHIVYQSDYAPNQSGSALMLQCSGSANIAHAGTSVLVALPEFTNPLSELEILFTTAMADSIDAQLEIGYIENENQTVFHAIDTLPNNYYYSEQRRAKHRIIFGDYPLPDTLHGRIAFRWLINSGWSYTNVKTACIDDILVRPVPECLDPTDVQISDITYQSATFSWTIRDTLQDTWKISYGGNSIVVHQMPYTLLGLHIDEEYMVSVRALCGDDLSYWSDSVTFRTLCEYITITESQIYQDDFSDYNATYNVFEVTDVPDCWTFHYYGYWDGFAPHIYNGSFAMNNASLLLSVGEPYCDAGQTLFAVFPPITNPLNELQVDFDLFVARDHQYSHLDLGYLTVREDTSTFHTIAVVPENEYTDFDSRRRYNLSEADPIPDGASLCFRLQCTDRSTHFYSIDNVRVRLASVSTPENPAETLEIFPNPTSGRVTIKHPNIPEGSILQITDVAGQVLMRVPTRGTQTEIDLHSFSNGWYLLQLVSHSHTTVVGKIVKP